MVCVNTNIAVGVHTDTTMLYISHTCPCIRNYRSYRQFTEVLLGIILHIDEFAYLMFMCYILMYVADDHEVRVSCSIASLYSI